MLKKIIWPLAVCISFVLGWLIGGRFSDGFSPNVLKRLSLESKSEAARSIAKSEKAQAVIALIKAVDGQVLTVEQIDSPLADSMPTDLRLQLTSTTVINKRQKTYTMAEEAKLKRLLQDMSQTDNVADKQRMYDQYNSLSQDYQTKKNAAITALRTELLDKDLSDERRRDLENDLSSLTKGYVLFSGQLGDIKPGQHAVIYHYDNFVESLEIMEN